MGTTGSYVLLMKEAVTATYGLYAVIAPNTAKQIRVIEFYG